MRVKVFWIALTFVALMLSTSICSAEEYVPGRLIAKFQDEASTCIKKRVLNQYHATQKQENRTLKLSILKVPRGKEKILARLMGQKAALNFAEVDVIAMPNYIPNDPSIGSAWHLSKISAPEAWDTTIGSSQIIIAIADTGTDEAHPDLAAHLIPGWNFYNNNSDTRDVYGHGTKVAGAAAAIIGNGIGSSGICGNCKIMPLRIAAPSGSATHSTITNAITYAANKGAKVVNISFGSAASPTWRSSTIRSAAQYMYNKGGVVVFSAGNETTSYTDTAQPHMLIVGATDSNDALAYFSNTGTMIDVVAPGISIFTSTNGGSYAQVNGTSFSAPITAGLAGLIYSINPSFTASKVRDLIKKGADDLGYSGWDPKFGWGRINAATSIAMARGSVPTVDVTTPLVVLQSPVAGSTLSATALIQVSASDHESGLKNVSLFINKTLLSTISSSPYTFSLNTNLYSNGAYSLEAKGTDNAGNVGSSGLVAITIQNSKTDPTPTPTPTSTPTLTPTSTPTSKATGDTQAPTAPKNLEATRVATTVNLKWTGSTDNVGVAGYRIFRNGAWIYTVSAGSRSASNFLRSYGTYQYYVVAFDASGNVSAPSNIATVVIP